MLDSIFLGFFFIV